jgi:putative endonuclease
MADTTVAPHRAAIELAAAHLNRLRFVEVTRNYRTRLGCLDLVAYDGYTLVFASVTALRAGADTVPDTLVMAQRARQMRRTATAWLGGALHRPRARALRFDALNVVLDARGRLVDLQHQAGAL